MRELQECAIAEAGGKFSDDEAITAEGFGVDDAAAQAPRMGLQELRRRIHEAGGVPVGRLKMVRSKDHAFVPMDGLRCHGIDFGAGDRNIFDIAGPSRWRACGRSVP